jgi:hypothetical protein
MTTAKILWNSVLSTPEAKYACAVVGNFYLATPMERYEYMKIRADLIPDAFLTNTTSVTKYTRVSYTARSDEACTASRKQASLPTSY